jgi:hypothetical protein
MSDPAQEDPQRAEAHLREVEDATRIQLISTELDLGITFCHIAANTENPSAYKRNIAHAEKAYAAVMRFLELMHQPDIVDDETRDKIRQLRSLVDDLKPPAGLRVVK